MCNRLFMGTAAQEASQVTLADLGEQCLRSPQVKSEAEAFG